MNLTYIRVRQVPVRAPAVDQRKKTHFAYAILFCATTLVVPHNCTAGLLVMTACGRATASHPLQPITNGTISRELGLLPAAATAFLWVMVVEHPLRNSKAHCCWQDLHDPLLDSERRPSFSTTLPLAWLAVRSGRMIAVTKYSASSRGTATRPATRSLGNLSGVRGATQEHRAGTNSRGALYWRLKTDKYKGNRWV